MNLFTTFSILSLSAGALATKPYAFISEFAPTDLQCKADACPTCNIKIEGDKCYRFHISDMTKNVGTWRVSE